MWHLERAQETPSQDVRKITTSSVAFSLQSKSVIEREEPLNRFSSSIKDCQRFKINLKNFSNFFSFFFLKNKFFLSCSKQTQWIFRSENRLKVVYIYELKLALERVNESQFITRSSSTVNWFQSICPKQCHPDKSSSKIRITAETTNDSSSLAFQSQNGIAQPTPTISKRPSTSTKTNRAVLAIIQE